jgi:hypothetical protein
MSTFHGNLDYGIIANEGDIERRKYFFGNNKRKLPEVM